MEGRNSSVLKNRSSSGCLVIKKKPVSDCGAGSSGSRKVYESKKEKKRGRMSAGESVSSEEELSDCYRRRDMGEMSGSVGYDDDGVGFGRNELMREGGVKRSKVDVYDFDEYDDLSNVDMLGARFFYDRAGSGGERRFCSPRVEMNGGGGGGVGFESGSSKGDIIYKRRNAFHGGMSSERIASGDFYSGKRRLEMKSEFPATMGWRFGGSDDTIRLQGRNGVLKVKVKNKSEIIEEQPQGYRPLEGNNVVRRCQELTAKSIIIQRHSPYMERQLLKKPAPFGSVDRNQGKKRKSFAAKSSEECGEESEDGDPSPKLQPDNVEVRRPGKRGRKPANLQSPGTSHPIKMGQGKVRRGSGTEKQLLREKIKRMLMNAGWTIDYRPRRGRDYSDAVYVNPTGTAYWSIIKAYDALQKQLEEEGKTLDAVDDDYSFAPISDDLLSKLTRQTRQKIEKELKRKKRDEGGSKKKRGRPSRTFEEDESDTDSGGSGRPDEKLSTYMKRNGKSVKGSSKDGSSSNSQMRERGEKSSSLSSSRLIHARRSKKIGRCTLLVRHSEKGLDSGSDGFVPYTGRRNLLSWLIDSGTVNLSEKVHYMNHRRTRIMLEGWITKEGIHCACCSKILSVTKFEIHAASKLRQPFQNIYLSSGASLLQCQVDAWNKQDEPLRSGFNKLDVEGDDPNDDTCAICGDGGDLMCCDSCPSTFHQSCLDIKMLPPGDWHCPHCSCKFCGLADISTAEGNDAIQDTLLRCSLCEGKCHYSCMEMGSTPANCAGHLFCGRICQELFERLQKILGVKYELEGGLCWSLIYRTDLASDESTQSFPQKVEWNSKLAVALTIMDECFLAITDRRSGINMIHNVLYNCGSNFTRLNYSGFYTAVLERGDEIVSAASIRIHGTKCAEMPFIGTRHIYRRQGMCRRLLFAIELALRSLKVEKLVIPAISELMDTWTRVFGFKYLEESDKQEMKTMNMLVFPGTDMLQKNLFYQDSLKQGLPDLEAFQAGNNSSDVPDLTKNSDFDSSPEPQADALEERKINDKSNTDVSSGAVMDSGNKTVFLNTAPMYVCDEVKLPCHGASTDVSNKPMVLGEERQGTTRPTLQLNFNTNESDGDPNGHVPPEASVQSYVNVLDNADGETEVAADCQLTKETGKVDSDLPCAMPFDVLVGGEERRGTTSPTLQLNFKESEADDFLEDHVPPDASVQTFVYALDNAGGKPQVAADCQFTKEIGNVDPDSGCEVACDVFAGSKDRGRTTSRTLQLNVKANEAGYDLKDHVPQDANVQILINALDNAAGKRQVEADGQLTKETSNVDSDLGRAMACDVLALSEERQGTTSLTLQLNVKTNESGDDLKDHVVPDASVQNYVNALDNGDGGPEVAAECQFSKETGSVDSDLGCAMACNVSGMVDKGQGDCSLACKIRPAADTDIGCLITDNKLADAVRNGLRANDNVRDDCSSASKTVSVASDAKPEVSADCKLTQETIKAQTYVGYALTDNKLDTTVDNGLPGNNNVQDDCSLGSKAVSAANGAQASLSEASHDDLEEKESVTISLAADNGRDYREVKVDDIRAAPNKDAVLCSESQSLHVTNLTAQSASPEQNHVSGTDVVCSETPELLTIPDGDGSHGSPLNGSIGVANLQPGSSNRFSCQPTLEDAVQQAKDVVIKIADVRSASRSL